MIASEGGEVGLATGIALLRAGASALDAVEAAVRVVESNEADHHVGVGGLPNLLGEVELDASIMDGATRQAGPGAAVTGRPPPLPTARAVAGGLGAGVSTSGYPWKYPGGVSDWAIIGAGNYCDNRVGAAACTGRGELAIRGTTARSVLRALAAGADPAQACAVALAETLDLPDEFRSPLQALCLTPDGRHGGASTTAGASHSATAAERKSFPSEERW